jgi:hypothetical protein
MLKIVSVCAALILAAATFSTSAVAQKGGYFGGGKMSFGGFKGASVGGYRGPSVSGFRGPTMSGARYAAAPYRGGMYRSGVGSGRYVYGGSNYGGRYASGYGYRYPYRRHGYGYWPWAVGAGLAVAATGAYYGGDGYGYDDYGGYGYNDCVQWRPDWGWVNVCESYDGYYPY